MWNTAGTNILVGLGEMAKSFDHDLRDALRGLEGSVPTAESIEALVVRLCHAKESLQRCLTLRNDVSMAIFNKKPIEAVTQGFLEQLSQEEAARWNALDAGTGLGEGRDYIERVSLASLATIREAVSDFRNVAPVEV